MHNHPALRRRISSALIALLSVLILPATHAATFVVTTDQDILDGGDEVVSLREAIIEANTAAGADTITFDSTVFDPETPVTISLSSVLPDLTSNITITGPGANALTVQGEGVSDPYRIFRVTTGQTVSISGLTIANGVAQGTNGTDGVNIGTPPTAGSIGLGGGIYNSGNLTLTGCVFSQNFVYGGAGGTGAGNINQHGAIGADGFGGGIYSDGTTLTIVGCTFSGNQASGGGGGAGASIQFGGGSSGNGAAAANGRGGAIYVSTGIFTITSSTFAGNIANGGAGGNGGTADFVSAQNLGGAGGIGEGGAIYTLQPVTLTSCTIAAGAANAGSGGSQIDYSQYAASGSARGGGIYAGAMVTIGNTLVAGNSVSNPGAGVALGPDVFGTFSSQNFNLIGALDGNATGINGAADQSGTIGTPLDPKLASIANNGGTITTLRLRKSSPAVDKGNDLTGIGLDQRGNSRPVNLADGTYPNAIGGDGSDIGAFESQTLPNDAPVTSSQTYYGNISVAVNTQLTGSDPDGDSITFEVVSGDLPDGLVLNSDGTITGTPDEAAEVLVTFKVNDGVADSEEATVAIYIAEAPSGVVTTDQDVISEYDGLISIHEAIGYVTNYALNVPITFDSTFFASHKTINLTSGLIALSSIDITGPPSGVTINGGNTYTLFTVYGFSGTPVYNFSNLTLINGRASGNGGALKLSNLGAAPTMNLSNCTFKNNGHTNVKGGAIAMNGGTLTLTNCTLTGNFANFTSVPSGGGAIYQAAGSLTLYHCTLTGNQSTSGTGGAIWSEGGTLSIGSSIIAANTSGIHPDISGNVTSLGYNLIGNTTGTTISGDTTGNQLNVSAGFDPEGLADNGGATQTIALAPGSLAIDQGKVFNSATIDQRGEPRPYDDPGIANASGGDGSDIGAYETPAPTSEILVALTNGGKLSDGFGTVNFGNTQVGTSTDLGFNVANSGTLDLTLSGNPKIAVSGTHETLFVVTAQPASPVTPDGTTTFTVRFTPDSLGVKTAALTIINNDSDETPFNIAITGTGADLITATPILTSPSASTVTGSPIGVSLTLPEAGLAGSATLTFSGTTTHTITLASAAQGTQSFSFNPASPGDNTEISFATPIPDGVYSVTLSYQDAAGNPAATVTSTNVTIDTTAPAITVSPATRLALAGTLADYTDLAEVTDETETVVTQSPTIGTTTTVGVLTITLTATDAVGLQDSTTFDLDVRPAAATSTEELASGDTPPGAGLADGPPADAKLTTFGMPAIDDDGNLAYLAKWSSATGGKGSGLFLNNTCLGVVGGEPPIPFIHLPMFGPLPTYKSFTDPVVDGGNVATIAKFTAVPAPTASAVLSGSPLAVIARAGDIAKDITGVQPTDGAKFKAFKAVAIKGTAVAFLAQLTGGLGAEKATAANDYGLWIKDGANPLTLAVREGQAVGGKTIKTLLSFASGNGSPGQGRGWLTQPGGPAVLARVIFTDKSQAVISAVVSGGGVTVFAETGVAGTDKAPALTDATFASFGIPAANDNDTCTFLGSLTVGDGDVTAANARGVFLSTGSDYAALARVGDDAGSTGGTFKLFKDPVLSPDDGVAFQATLKGLKGIATSSIWWKPNGEALSLLAQGGEQPGPDLSSEAQWKTFTSLAIAGGRGPIFAATLVPNKGGVTAAKASGVWGCDFNGEPRLLFRTGDTIGGKTVKSFVLLKAVVGSAGVSRSFNENAQVVWLATFTDKSQAIITTEVP